MFDEITSSKLGYYVYALVNPINGKVFYIGKGIANRVFAHVEEVLNLKEIPYSIKQSEINELLKLNKKIEHYILRHGLTEKEAFLIESVLIDYNNTLINKLTNEVNGHSSAFWGIKSTDELIRQYNAPKLDELSDPVVIININRKYKDTKSKAISVYEATKQAWVISGSKIKNIKYALAEFQGIIIAVYKITNWYQILTEENKTKVRRGFDGIEAPEEIKQKYFHKSIAHHKKQGAANPIRFKL
ncbi:MAG: hypothetical protein RL108_119 [Bacteroidota bacterium]|jgi:hypothetical protein